MKIVFATNNRHKVSEVQCLLDQTYQILTPAELGITEDIPEEQDTLQGNASQKSHYIYDRMGVDCFADDTGLEVEVLGGAPGVYSARYAGTDHDSAANMKLLLENMAGVQNRKARFRTVISLLSGGEEHLFEGIVEGHITDAPNGMDGFGYDPIFVPEGYDVTFAQMSQQEKNRISHRGRAVQKLIAFLNAQTR